MPRLLSSFSRVGDPVDCGPPGPSVLQWVACPPPGNLPNPGIEPAFLTSPALAGNS